MRLFYKHVHFIMNFRPKVHSDTCEIVNRDLKELCLSRDMIVTDIAVNSYGLCKATFKFLLMEFL